MRADDVYAILKGKIVKLTEDIKEVGDWKPIRHQGTVQTAEDLPADAKEGHMYNVATDSVYGAAGMNVVKTADGWDPMGPIVNMDLYLSKEEAKKGYQPAGDYLTEDKAKETYQPVGNYSTKEETEKKLNKNQGIDNAGKITGINADGDIVPVFPTGVQYNEETNLLEFGTDPNMLNKGIQLDATLKKSGYAADSATVGENIDSLKEDLVDLATFGKNLFNKETATIGYTLDNNGELTNDSSVIPNAPQYLTSDFIPCEKYAGMYFYIGPENGAVCFYDDNKIFISKVSNILYSNGRKIISTAKHLRFTTAKTRLNTICARVSTSMPTEPPVYDEFGIKINNDVNIPHDNSKVDKSQGVENSGKYLKIGEDGNLIPTNAPVDNRMYIGETVTNAGQQEETISIGVGAGRNVQNGYIAIGHGAMGAAEESTANNDNGKYSVAIGHRALGANTTGDHNTAVGWGCLGGNKTGNGNTAVGEDALCHSVDGDNNTCIGNRAYQMGLGSNNVVIGATAMYSSISGKNTPTGNSNVAVGAGSGAADGNGDNNTAVGTGAKQDANLRFSIAIGALAEAHKTRQVVIGSTKSGASHPLESIFNGDIIICGTDMKFRKLIFNDDGTIKWEDVSANYSNYIN